MRKLIYILFLGIIYSCNNSTEPIDPSFFEKQPEPNEVKIDIDGLNDIVYTNVSAITMEETTPITIDGIFKNPYIDNGIEDFPVLLVENENILLGYFPHTLQSNKVNIDDIILFYFLIYPEIAIQGFNYQDVMNRIKTSDNYNKLKELVITDLNSNKSPLDNDNFNSLIRTTGVKIKESLAAKTSRTKKGGTDTFKFSYDREGLVSWLDEVPLYAAVGISIKNDTKGDVVLPPKILKNKSLVLSPTSVIFWAYNELFTDKNEVKTESLNLTNNGTYTIAFSNGNGVDSDLNAYVKNKNRGYMGSNMLGLIIPIGIKSLKLDSNCANAIDEVVIDVLTKVDQLLLEEKVPDTEETIKILVGLSESAVKSITECVKSTGSMKLYLKILGSSFVKNLSTIEDISTLSLLLRDYVGSNISGSEQRFFNNGVSFGDLKGKDESETEFEGDIDTEHTYFKTFEEKEIIYNVDRGVLSSVFEPEEKWSPAVNLPFIPNVTSGNADVSDNYFDNQGQVNTSTVGKIEIKIVMGNEKSKVEIKPDFESDFVDSQTVTLTPPSVINLVGNMNFGDIKINTTKGELLTIENNTDEVLNISSINFPDGFSSTWESEPIQPNSSQSFIVVFEPKEVKEYSGTITVYNNLDDINNKIEVSGTGTDDKITLEGNLDFGNIEINPDTPPSLSFYISNYNLNRTIFVEPINNLPEGFSATGWVEGGELVPSAKKEVIITFNPTEVKDYSSVIEIINDVDEINNKINVIGAGYNGNILIEGTWFGETTVTECQPARFDTVTPNCEMHAVLNERDVQFIGDTNLSCNAGLECGLVIFDFYTGTESVLKNKYEFDGTTLTIEMITTSSGSYFNGRTYNYTGTINATGDKIEGNYTMDMPGGIWGAYTEGTMTFTKN